MKPNHSNSDIYGDIDSWSLKEAPERLKVNSDNLKEQISEILDLVEVGVGGVTRLKGDEWVDGISVDKATNQILALIEGLERQARISELKYWCAIDDIDSGLTYMDDGEACIRLTTLSDRIKELEREE